MLDELPAWGACGNTEINKWNMRYEQLSYCLCLLWELTTSIREVGEEEREEEKERGGRRDGESGESGESGINWLTA